MGIGGLRDLHYMNYKKDYTDKQDSLSALQLLKEGADVSDNAPMEAVLVDCHSHLPPPFHICTCLRIQFFHHSKIKI